MSKEATLQEMRDLFAKIQDFEAAGVIPEAMEFDYLRLANLYESFATLTDSTSMIGPWPYRFAAITMYAMGGQTDLAKSFIEQCRADHRAHPSYLVELDRLSGWIDELPTASAYRQAYAELEVATALGISDAERLKALEHLDDLLNRLSDDHRHKVIAWTRAQREIRWTR